MLTLWSEVTGRPINTNVQHRLSVLDGRALLFDSDYDTLAEAAEQTFHFHGHLAFADWAEGIQNTKRTQHLQSGGLFADAPPLIGLSVERQRAHNRVTDFVGETMKAGWVAGINQITLREAMMRIDQRATMGQYNLGSLVQRKTRWRKELTAAVGTPPVIEADAAEALIVHLLALTHPNAQF